MTASDLVHHFPMQSREEYRVKDDQRSVSHAVTCACGFRCSSIEDVARKMWAQHVLEVTK